MRLDQWLVARGYAATRSRARWLIESGAVRVAGQPCQKPACAVSPSSQVEVRAADLRYVGRGGLKLEHALTAFRVELAGCVALDIGASTGGFTDCLLQHGARRVYALDVGTEQLHPSLRGDPRVISLERRNLRTFAPTELAEPVDLITVDVSFISLSLVLPLLPPFLRPRGRVIALIKPQFEVGKRLVGRGGMVRSPDARSMAVHRVLEMASAVGFRVMQTTDAPHARARRNQEVFACLDWDAARAATAPNPCCHGVALGLLFVRLPAFHEDV
jgi:23S rRNA (cytidine1920-2'-O)/16S rRNA (cytidine1409-2'-O)-methyltransferase